MTNPVGTTAEVLYRFFCGYEGFGDGVPLGFEAVSPGDGAVFSVEPSLVYRTKYINGGGMVRGVCSVTLPARDNDRAARVRASAFLASLSDYAAENGRRITDDSMPGEVIRIYPASSPARLRAAADGAVWELTFAFEKSSGRRDEYGTYHKKCDAFLHGV